MHLPDPTSCFNLRSTIVNKCNIYIYFIYIYQIQLLASIELLIYGHTCICCKFLAFLLTWKEKGKKRDFLSPSDSPATFKLCQGPPNCCVVQTNTLQIYILGIMVNCNFHFAGVVFWGANELTYSLHYVGITGSILRRKWTHLQPPLCSVWLTYNLHFVDRITVNSQL